MAHDALTGLFRSLNRERQRLIQDNAAILRTQLEVAAIAAPTGLEHRRAEWLRMRLVRNGVPAELDDIGNVVARIRGTSAERVAVCAHLDTVFANEDPAVRTDGARVFAPGICDNARGLAVLLAISSELARQGRLRRSIDFVGTVGEEGCGDLRGMRHYLASNPRPASVIVLDGAGDSRIVTRGLGSRRFRVAIAGPGGHSWNDYGSANPIHAASGAIGRIASLSHIGHGPGRNTVTVARIEGGSSVNAIPSSVWFEVDTRSTNERSLDHIEHELRGIVSGAVESENRARLRDTGALRVVIDTIGRRPAGETDAEAPLLRHARDATRLVGREPELATASTDANAAMAVGIPAVAIGAGGRGGGAHSANEWFENEDSDVGVIRAFTLVASEAMAAD